MFGMHMSEFDAWAPYYDLIHVGLPDEVPFYTALARQSGGPVLELGCGTGRITLPIALSGASITGLELSPAMLALCREKAALCGALDKKLSLVQGDMRAFKLEQRFPLILMPYRTFMHLLTPSEQVACLECVREHLTPGGLFALNLWAARPSLIPTQTSLELEKHLQLSATHTLPEENLVLLHFHSAHYDEFNQRIHELHRMVEKDPQGKTLGVQDLGMTRAWLTPREMEHLVCRCGFRVEALYGDFDASPPGPESREMIWLLRA